VAREEHLTVQIALNSEEMECKALNAAHTDLGTESPEGGGSST
jgi:hypothetical protein